MAKSLVEMAADIIQSQTSSKSMSTEEVVLALQNTFNILQTLQQNEQTLTPEFMVPTPSVGVTPEKSILKNKIICLECGEQFKMLSAKHLASHELTGREYRKKHGLKLRQPLCAKSLSAERQKAGKARGIPENLKKTIASRSKASKESGAVASAKGAVPKPGKSRKAAK